MLVVGMKAGQPDAVIVLNSMSSGLYLRPQMREMKFALTLYCTLVGAAHEAEVRQPLVTEPRVSWRLAPRSSLSRHTRVRGTVPRPEWER